MSDTITNLFHGEGNPRNSEGAFVELKDGRILFAYTRYKGASWADAATADIVGRISTDGGRTWGDWKLIFANRAQNVMSVSLLRLQDGRIALIFLEKSWLERIPKLRRNVQDKGILDCRPWISFSSDEGETWTEPVDVCEYPPIYIVVNNDRLVQLSSGRLILPMAIHHKTSPNIKDDQVLGESNHNRSETFFFLSDDGGANWREAKQCCYPPQWLTSGLREPGVVELKDGRVMAWFRTNADHQYKAFSSDGGESWTQAVPAPEFPSNESPLSIKRDPTSGDLVAVWSDLDPRWGIKPMPESWFRTPLVIARSSDDGETWHDHRILEGEPDHGFCYIAMLFTQGGLLLAYCCGGGKGCAVLQDLRIRRIEWK